LIDVMACLRRSGNLDVLGRFRGLGTEGYALMDERFLAVEVAGKGLVVLSACSHAGIVNVLHHARATFPGVGLHAVMGGFHLSGPTEAAIGDTVSGLGEFDLDYIVPAHCTGWRAVNALERAYGEKVVPTAAGKMFSF
jgi:7,8-dihydropterin-6-yl-methyl-4-(beta-D-ribofuranosyl)aminobenzene 5'-phosphate synthase